MEESLSTHRSKRQKIDKTGRLSALEKLKQAKASNTKNKYKVDEVEKIYDEVDEKDYNKRVLDRQCEDWIVDDGSGTGYIEDGRDIFDDDLDDESIREASKHEAKGPRKRKREQDANKGKITSMFKNMSNKQKSELKSTEDDDILGDLMSELKKDTPVEEKRKVQQKNVFSSKQKKEKDDEELLSKLINEENKKKKEIPPSKEHLPAEPVKSYNKPVVDNEVTINDIQENGFDLESVNFEDDITGFNGGNEITKNKENNSLTNNTAIPKDDVNLGDLFADISEADFNEKETPKETEVTIQSPVVPKSKPNLLKESERPVEHIAPKAWEETFTGSSSSYVSESVNLSKVPFPYATNSDREKVFRFFWYDAFEDPFKQPGIVYLFGKVYIESLKEYVSCCIAVKNISRKLFLLPRESIKNELSGEMEEVTMEQVYNEFNLFAKNKLNIHEFRVKEVSKKYAFERENTPNEADYLEVQYAAKEAEVDPNYSGKVIEGVFGTSTTALESLLIERNIKGPCWLDIKEPLPVENSFSWCKAQVNCMKMNNVVVTNDKNITNIVPPIVIATINVQVSLDPKLQKNEVVMIGILFHHKFYLDKSPPNPPFDKHCCLITHPKNTPLPMYARSKLPKIPNTNVIICENELELLEKFLDTIEASEPDLIVGFDCDFQLEVLLNKIISLKIKNWSKVGKLKRFVHPYIKGKLRPQQFFCGRPICDISNSARELNIKVKSYDLASLCVSVLNKSESECKEVKPEDCINFYSSCGKLETLISTVMSHTLYIINIVIKLNVLPLALQITNITGNVLSRTFSAGRSERNEFLLLHAFYNKGYITPDKRKMLKKSENDENATSTKKKPQYMGGLVLEPKKGFYDKLILLMDFNSLYPSIIQEYNLCFTTVPGAAYADMEDLQIPDSSTEAGIVPTEIRKLVQSRTEVKKLMKQPNLSSELRMQYDIRQLALKLTANSMYGCLGAVHNRFYAKGLAALITSKGREILTNTKSLVEKANFDVIYGDTDSIMVNTNNLDYDNAFTIGKDIKQKVNKLYKRVELDIDGVFRYLLLLKKKKYAAVTMTKTSDGEIKYVKEIKGLDIVRRDWCGLACDAGNQVLDFLLSDRPNETRLDVIFEYLQKLGNDVRENNIKLPSFVITKQLSKNPSDYPANKRAQLSHVSVAHRLNELGGRMWKSGDVIPFIICEDGTNRSATERAYHIDEFKKSETLKIDIDYYLLNQVLPVVLRICDPIDGIDDVLLAENLGIQNYKSTRKVHEKEINEIPITVKEDRFKKCLPLIFTCKSKTCNAENEIRTTFTETPKGIQPSLTMCLNPECDIPPWKYGNNIQNKLQLEIRRLVKQYYYGEVECENPVCSKVSRRITLDTRGHLPNCYECKDGNVHRIYEEIDLYDQLCFYLHLFTITPAQYKSLKPAAPRELINVYDNLKEFVESQIQCNAHSIIDLTKLFWPKIQESDLDVNMSSVEKILNPATVEDFNEEQSEVV